MSTKATIRYGDDYHLYEEVFEPDTVYLELDDAEWVEIQKDAKTRVCIRFSLQKALELGLVSEEYVKKRKESDQAWRRSIANFKAQKG